MTDGSNSSPLSSLADRMTPTGPSVELDATDRRLLVELSADARVPQRRLAELLGMSSPAVADRIARLKARGVIRGFRVDIDWDRLGHSTVAFLSIVVDSTHDPNGVISRLLEVRGVEDITLVTGSTDLVVRLRTHGFDDLRWILASEIWNIPGVQQTETSISLLRAEPENATARMLTALDGAAEQHGVSAGEHAGGERTGGERKGHG
ncbi:Lrp/AsnC family transcriptional regulator [Galbitalea sp. SE-J8]|uniref:Lrp/AsnC family transcriptional regulator n=1 Tax=Galbitalea sp. SE-J8 TaxID=3054952 RepID=UPI00259CE691|nr:Lrp/AsnC family transcriptional regulator [Galbitalea sp. SE-J8]MDM4763876.1 Lrp/AsnC family transcriptional regulator [Galbitalea sp. SE-J8]